MTQNPKILIVEDDHMQASFVRPALEQAFRGSEIRQIKTEHEFRVGFDEIANNPPDVIVMDVMLRWTDPAPDQVAAPDDVASAGVYHAGIRCTKLLADNEKTNRIPVILYTVLETADIGQELATLSNHPKSLTKDADFAPLIQMIEQVLHS